MNLDQIRAALGTTAPWIVLTAIGSTAVLSAAVLAAGAWRLRKRNVTVKSTIGLAVVQVGFSFIFITGVYDFWHLVIHTPAVESAILAVIVEAATWAGAGRIYEHGRTEVIDPRTKKLTPSTGWGLGGIIFWPATIGGAILAVLAAPDLHVGLGRVVIVTIGVGVWYVQLSRVTRRRAGKSQWRWTPRRLLIALGILAPTGTDLDDDARAWQVARLARAIRWRNSSRLFSWWGKRTLRRLADRTPEDMQGEAMRRWAAGHVLIKQTAVDSAIMQSAIASVGTAQMVAVTTAPLVVPSEIGTAVGPPEPPVDRWRREIGSERPALDEAPVSPAVTTELEVDKWRVMYADAITFIKDVWRHGDGHDWFTADDPPGRNEVMRIMAGFGKWTAAGTCGRLVQVIIADRAEFSGVNQPPPE